MTPSVGALDCRAMFQAEDCAGLVGLVGITARTPWLFLCCFIQLLDNLHVDPCHRGLVFLVRFGPSS